HRRQRGPRCRRRGLQLRQPCRQPDDLRRARRGSCPGTQVGHVLVPETIISESEDTKIETASGIGVLLTAGAVAGLAHKRLFAEKYHAQAVDMEAFAVADVARIYNVPFIAMKAISDEFDFDLPPLGRFITDTGDFRTAAFVAYAAVRPWIWMDVAELDRNSQ